MLVIWQGHKVKSFGNLGSLVGKLFLKHPYFVDTFVHFILVKFGANDSPLLK